MTRAAERSMLLMGQIWVGVPPLIRPGNMQRNALNHREYQRVWSGGYGCLVD